MASNEASPSRTNVSSSTISSRTGPASLTGCSRSGADAGGDRRAAAGGGVDVEDTALGLQPLAHAGEAVAGRRARLEAAPVVDHLEHDLVAEGQSDVHEVSGRMAAGIGQRLLRHAVER